MSKADAVTSAWALRDKISGDCRRAEPELEDNVEKSVDYYKSLDEGAVHDHVYVVEMVPEDIRGLALV